MKKNVLISLAICFMALLTFEVVRLERKVNHTKKQMASKCKKLQKTQLMHGFSLRRIAYGRIDYPKELKEIPYSDAVIETKNIELRNVSHPHNGSILQKDDGSYSLFFRYDVIKHTHLSSYFSYLGYAELDRDFKQTPKDFVRIPTDSLASEDPRAIPMGKEVILVYNDLIHPNSEDRYIHLARLDRESLQTKAIEQVDLHPKQIEKNWAPFISQTANGEEKLFFEYQLDEPRKILKLEGDKFEEACRFVDANQNARTKKWKETWGELRGGTPAQKVGNEYLSFFHSSFTDSRNTNWYVMGAYTFESKPPFRVTKISPYPILFEGIYDTPSKNTAYIEKCSIYPTGFVTENRGGQKRIHLSCGENDSGIKIVTLDQEKLLHSLVRVDE